ncbi:hypothetical protein Droror1_Dr00016753 [Drosera rotundifolia]
MIGLEKIQQGTPDGIFDMFKKIKAFLLEGTEGYLPRIRAIKQGLGIGTSFSNEKFKIHKLVLHEVQATDHHDDNGDQGNDHGDKQGKDDDQASTGAKLQADSTDAQDHKEES